MRAGRVPPDAEVRIEAVTGSAFVRADTLELYRSLRNEAALAYADRFGEGPPPILTALLVGVQIRVWWLAKLPGVTAALVTHGTKYAPPVFEDGQVWRLVTMGLLHTDFLHIVLNMIWLAYVGWNLERALGRANLAVLFLASVAGGSTLSVFLSTYAPSLGASGGVFGLIAAATVFGYVRADVLPARSRRWFGPAMLPYLLLMFWSGWSNPSTDNWAHLGGLVTGAVLGLVIDPDAIERRPGWARRVRWLTVVGVLALLAGLWGLGPRVDPLLDSEVARSLARDGEGPPPRVETGPRALRFAVPGGWRPALDAAREAAFVAPIGGGRDRAFGVRLTDRARGEALEDVGARWRARITADWPQAVFSEPEPAEIAGTPGITVVARLGDPAGERLVRWTAASRGVWVLEVVWQVDEGHAVRLEPLHRRLISRIVWGEPVEFAKARDEYDAMPTSVRAREAYALALGRMGRTAEAIALHEGLVTEAPADADRWAAYIATVTAAGDAGPDLGAILDRALAASPDPDVAIAAADALDAAKRESDAQGLLTLAWLATPGGSDLRRALRRRGLSVALDLDTSEPWNLVHDPVTGGPRSRAEIDALHALPRSLAGAAQAAARIADDRERSTNAAAAAITAGDVEAAVAPLLILKDGYVPAGETDARSAVADDLRRAVGGSPPEWLPEAVATALAAQPAFADALSPPPPPPPPPPAPAPAPAAPVP